MFSESFAGIVRRGIFNTVGTDAFTAAVAWFLLSIGELEKAPSRRLPRSLGWALCFVILIGVVLMPVSGFWLALPPTVSLALGRSS